MFTRKKKYNNLRDRELINLYKSESDLNALGELFSRYAHLIASIALGILNNEQKAKDSVQDIFETTAADLKKYDVRNFNSWIYTVTKFHCFKIKNNNQGIELEGDSGFKDDFDEILEKELLIQKKIKLLENVLDKINPDERKCVELFYLKGYSYLEIVEETELSIKEVKSQIQKSKREINLLIDNNEEY